MVGIRLLRWWRNFCNLAGPYGQSTEVSWIYLRNLAGLRSAVSIAIFSKCCINILPPEIVRCPLPYPLFADRIYPQTGNTRLLNRCPVISLHLQFAKVSCSGKEGSVLNLFLMACKTPSTGTLVNRLTTWKRTRESSFWRLILCFSLMKCLRSSRRGLYCQLEGSESYGENLLGHNRESE
jgi:hypothetical protein